MEEIKCYIGANYCVPLQYDPVKDVIEPTISEDRIVEELAYKIGHKLAEEIVRNEAYSVRKDDSLDFQEYPLGTQYFGQKDIEYKYLPTKRAYSMKVECVLIKP